MQGVCLSGSECDARGGVILGSCAQGFGSCCAVYISSCTSDNFRHNLTYIVSPGPSPLDYIALVTTCHVSRLPGHVQRCGHVHLHAAQGELGRLQDQAGLRGGDPGRALQPGRLHHRLLLRDTGRGGDELYLYRLYKL